VHVHNARPDTVIAFGLSAGTLSRITIENLDNQTHDVREARAVAFVGGVVGEAGHHAAGHADPEAMTASGREERGANRMSAATADRDGNGEAPGVEAAGRDPEAAPTTRLPIGIVAVAPSDGLAEVLIDTATEFREHGAFHVVRGGQSANPSTGELYEAVEAMQADELFILPNNPNVILAARQVASMTDRPVHVIPTRNVAEGVAALIELDPTKDGETNAAAMTRASRGVQSMQVTEAVRDATVSGRKVKRGQSIVLDPDDGLLAADADPQRAVLAGIGHLERGYCLMTIYYGAGATLDEAETLALRVRETTPGVDVEVVHGGQPHYRYLVSAE
jgi:dihydroxyacetone kinase-like predicted kinase